MIMASMRVLGHPAVAALSFLAIALSAVSIVGLVFVGPAFPGIARVVLNLCGYDAVSGAVRADGLAALLAQLYLFAAIVFWLYADDVLAWWRQSVSIRGIVTVAAILPLVGFLIAFLSGRAVLRLPEQEWPSIRSPLTLPDVGLIDQTGATFRTSDLAGRITLLTFVYADCSESCPLLARDVQDVLAAFPADGAGRDLTAIALTLDPLRDDPVALASAAQRWKVTDPRFRLATGDPADIQRILSAATFWQRRRGLQDWDHTNLIIVLDVDGHEAFSVNGGSDLILGAISRLLRGA